MDGIKNLIIDFGGVIVNLKRGRCIERFADLGIVDVLDQFDGTYRIKDIFIQLEQGSISSAQFRDGVRKLTTKSLSDKQIDNAWISMLDDVSSSKLKSLLKLRKYYQTMLLSNTNEIHWNYSLKTFFSHGNHEVIDYFDKIYLSYLLHMLKPSQEIYEFVLSDAGISPEETLLIDDSPANCRAAEKLGIRTYTPTPHEDWPKLFI